MAERLVVVGGDPAGMSAASQARKLRPHLEIVALEKGQWTSYSACGIPYHVAGDVGSLDDLVVRTPEEFRGKYRIDVRIQHEALAVDLDRRRVEVRDHRLGRTFQLPFDQLHLATGAVPARPDVPGADLPNVLGVQTLADARQLLDRARESRCRDVVVVGGGYIGLEMAEAFVRRGSAVTVVESGEQLMQPLDPDMGAAVDAAMRRFGIDVRLGVAVEAIEDGSIHTSEGRLDADVVVLGTGVTPNSGLASDAGVELGAEGAVAVDRRQRTSVEGVWSAGDCAETHHLVTGGPVHVALGTVANKAGRVAGVNIGGGYARFPGVVGTAITRICSTEVARTGLTESEAEEAGFAFRSTSIDTTTTAHYFPRSSEMTVKLVAEQGTGRLLGGQIVGGEGSAKRIDTLAMALHAGMDLRDLREADLAYAPPFSGVWDPVQVAARRALSQL